MTQLGLRRVPHERAGGKPRARPGRCQVSVVVRGVVAGLGLPIALATSSPAQETAPPPTPSAEEILRLPEVTISAPARLPGAALPAGSVPSAVQVITGEEIRQSGALSLQDYLQRLPGVTLNDEQGNSFMPDVSFRGFQVSPGRIASGTSRGATSSSHGSTSGSSMSVRRSGARPLSI